MDTEQRPALARAADTLASFASLLLVGFVLWRQFDPDFDPRELVAAVRNRVRSQLEHRRALYRQLDEILDLPETKTTEGRDQP